MDLYLYSPVCFHGVAGTTLPSVMIVAYNEQEKSSALSVSNFVELEKFMKLLCLFFIFLTSIVSDDG